MVPTSQAAVWTEVEDEGGNRVDKTQAVSHQPPGVLIAEHLPNHAAAQSHLEGFKNIHASVQNPGQ